MLGQSIMKKILLAFFFFTAIFSQSVSAQTITIPMPTISLTPSPGPTPVNYDLPYPGILPGAPLYIVKQIRDKFTELLPSDAYKKSEFYLLQADKMFAASLILYDRGEKDLALQSLTKSQKNLEKSFEKMKEAEKMQKNIMDISAKIMTSSEKQKQEISRLMESVDGKDLEELKLKHQKAQELQNKAKLFQ